MLILAVVGLALSAIAVVVGLQPRQRAKVRQLWESITRPSSPSEATTMLEWVSSCDTEMSQLFLSSPLTEEQLLTEYVDEWIEWPDQFRPLLESLLERERTRAAKEGRTLDNNLGFSLHRIDVQRPQTADGKRENRYTVQFFPSDYDHFIVPNTMLDELVRNPITQEMEALRQVLGLKREVLSLQSLARLPFHFRAGVGTVIETSDEYIVLAVRSARQLIAPGAHEESLRVHLSAGEGMLRAADPPGAGDYVRGRPTPFATSRRALRDELNLRAVRDYDPRSLRCLGCFLDRLRAQPFFIIYAKAGITLDEVFVHWLEGPADQHENQAIAGVPATASSIAGLLGGELSTSVGLRTPAEHEAILKRNGVGRPLAISTNQAKVGLLVAGSHRVGLRRLASELRLLNVA